MDPRTSINVKIDEFLNAKYGATEEDVGISFASIANGVGSKHKR